MNNLKLFATAVQAKVGGWEMLIPIFMQMLQVLLDQCANTEEQAVTMLTEPTPAQMRIMHRRVLLELHRERTLPLRDRNAMAWQTVYAGIEEASANPDMVVAAFREVKGTAA
jgi:hypothetical protein